MRRTEARELLMKMLFQMEAQGDYSAEAKQTYIETYLPESDQLAYFNEVSSACLNNLAEIDAAIESNAKGWKFNRIAKVDLAVMRLCIAEFKYSKGLGIPTGVSINEAINIVKKFGSEDSGKFVNGVLGAVSREK